MMTQRKRARTAEIQMLSERLETLPPREGRTEGGVFASYISIFTHASAVCRDTCLLRVS